MSKKEAVTTMTLKDFHGGSIPSAPGDSTPRPADCPVPSRPRVPAASAIAAAVPSIFTSPTRIGRHFDEDERTPFEPSARSGSGNAWGPKRDAAPAATSPVGPAPAGGQIWSATRIAQPSAVEKVISWRWSSPKPSSPPAPVSAPVVQTHVALPEVERPRSVGVRDHDCEAERGAAPLQAPEPSPTSVEEKQVHPVQVAANLMKVEVVHDVPQNVMAAKTGVLVVDAESRAAERPRLNLKPCSNAMEQYEETTAKERLSVFGGARPREQVLKERGVDVLASEVEKASPVGRHNMQHTLWEIETVLMAPDADDAAAGTKHEIEDNKPAQLMRQQSRTCSHDSRQSSPGVAWSQFASGYPPASYEFRPEKRQRELREDPQNIVKQLLTKCAEALSEERIEEFQKLVQEAGGVVSITGEPIQRLGAYLLEGLVARHGNSGTNIYRALKCCEPDSNELLSYMEILYNICPYFKFGYMAANGAIAEALRNEDRINIIDFQIAQGTQWITLIQALAARPGGPPHVRIIGIDDPMSEYARGEGLDIVGKMLKGMSEEFKIPLEFTPLPVYATQVTKEMLKIRPGEALAVNFTLQLHHTPDESVDVNNPRDGLLRMVKALSPKVITLVEQESHTNTTPFLIRFTETMDYYYAMFESIDTNLPRDSKERINVEQHCLAKDIVNIIACEGKDRVERHELLGKWKSRLTMAGFKPYPLSSYVNSVIKKLLACYSDKYTLEEKDSAMLLGWKNRKLISASAWH